MATPTPRTTSRFLEATMNSRSSIHPPPDSMWQDLGIEQLIDQYNEENDAPPGSRHDSAIEAQSTSSASASIQAPSSSASEGTFGRFSRAVSSLWHGSALSALGKRKAGADSASTPAPAPLDDRREQARLAYEEAKERGLLPTPKVFVRPVARARRKSAGSPIAQQSTPQSTPHSTPHSYLITPTRILQKSASKRDLNKQKKLTKRVSNLEHKLSEARRELGLALALKDKENAARQDKSTPVSPDRPLTPNKTHFLSEIGVNSHVLAEPSPANTNKITKRRKATEETSVPIYGDSENENENESEREWKKKIFSPLTPKRTYTRLVKKRSQVNLPSSNSSTTTTEEEVIRVAPDGKSVPPIPSIPAGIDGKRVTIRDDGFGGFSHEIF
ncbi:hypothetical protein K504DRAFT_466202 [Pleomassaria siparia CBS 279.74]|uniref:Uncharacterized protein n=1 Tax=Pleomassaria siparia CBS 279.74 TaxID=1314801 RepID=A0A6G1KED0_9PLEO|nr:hypothetical protein K504DRAFT_466202 [Pleomassaria siparia CBS 279.74]